MKQAVLFKILIYFLLAIPIACGRGDNTSGSVVLNSFDKILFLGNSITYSGQYVADIETYYRIRHPEIEVKWMNLGLPSETVSGLSEEGHADGKFPRPSVHERLQRVLQQTQPDLVFASYGMNDGIYLPFNEDRFEDFKSGMIRLHEDVVTSGAEIIHLTPPVYDEMNGGEAGYDEVLDRYSQWLLNQVKTHQWKVVDIHGPMKNYLLEKREKDPSFYLASDGVHPADEGHWIIAREILKYLGEKEVAPAKGLEEVIGKNSVVLEVRNTVRKKQQLFRDGWLTSTGHERPGLNPGLPIPTLNAQVDALNGKIDELLKEK